jgi:hypothetical protein
MQRRLSPNKTLPIPESSRLTAKQILIAATWLIVTTSIFADTHQLHYVYPSESSIILKLSEGLFETLDPKRQQSLSRGLVSLETCGFPITTSVERNQNRVSCQIGVSVAFVDLLNHIAHAKAIDRIRPGYFEQYTATLARQSFGATIPVAPDITDPRFWTDEIMSEQMSYFNEMIGMTMAINLSHQYLGHFIKYAPQMSAAKLRPINNLLTPSEWDVSVRQGARNALDCAIGTEGARALFEAIDKIPNRSGWTALIVPQNADLKELNKKLSSYEHLYYRGGLR